MRPTQLATLLAATIKARIPVLVTGAPGVGKTDVIGQAARLADADFILGHPSVEDPTVVSGLPWPGKGNTSATFLPFGALARALAATKLTVWCLDDLGQATPAVQAAYMQLILARRVNEHVLPDCVVFIAATNRRTDRAGVSGILEPVKSRFGCIVELEPNLDDWTQWALGAGVQAELIAFLRFRPNLLSAFTPSADMTNSPMPRTWASVSRLLNLGLPDAIQHTAIAGAVGEGAAVEFSAFLRLFKELPNIDGILLNPDKGDIPGQPATLYAVVTALGMKTTAKNFGAVAKYADRLVSARHGEFAALLLRDATRRDPTVMQTQAFVKLASGELGQLIAGGK